MASFSDDFNRANGAVGSNWTTLTGLNTLNVVDNACAGSSFICGGHVATATATFANDQEAECVINPFGAFDRGGPCVRMNGDNGYLVRAFTATVLKLERMDGGVLTGIGADITVSFPATVRLRVEGTTLTVYVDDVEVRTDTDATYASGQPGLYYEFTNSNVTRLDDFYAEDISAPPEPTGRIARSNPNGPSRMNIGTTGRTIIIR